MGVALLLRRMVGSKDVYFGCGNASAGYFAHFQTRAYVQCGGSFFKMGKWNAGVNKCAEQHVPTNAGKAFEISNTHRR